MGQGHYYAIVYGIVDKKFEDKELICIIEKGLEKKEWSDEEFCRVWNTCESDKEYIGILIATADKWLSDLWKCGFIETIEMVDVQEWTEKHFPKELKKAIAFWQNHIEPILNKQGYTKNPKLHFIKDYD